ncbi:MAG: hypothetical protein PUF01_05045, partial [Eubacteriales bacterium]|nr:hypothetical protein [Eubacteriales bacterium]
INNALLFRPLLSSCCSLYLPPAAVTNEPVLKEIICLSETLLLSGAFYFCEKIKNTLDIKSTLGCIVAVENKLGVRK